MNDSYFIRFRGDVTGPVGAERLNELIGSGSITALHEISTDQVRWITVRAWLQARTAPPPLPGAPAADQTAASNFRIKSDEARPEFPALPRFDYLSACAISLAMLGLFSNAWWILRNHVSHAESNVMMTLIMFAIPVLSGGLSMLVAAMRLFVGGRKPLALTALLIGGFALAISASGLAIDAFSSSNGETSADSQLQPTDTNQP